MDVAIPIVVTLVVFCVVAIILFVGWVAIDVIMDQASNGPRPLNPDSTENGTWRYKNPDGE